MSESPTLLVTEAPNNLPSAPTRAAWQALPGTAPRPSMPRRCSIVLQPYFDRRAIQQLRDADLPLAHVNLGPAKRCRRGFQPGLMQVQLLLERGLSQPDRQDLFPYLGPGAEIEARVEGLRMTPDRLQAELQLDVHGTRLTAFDAYSTQARSMYRRGQNYRFELTALALELAPTDTREQDRLQPARRAITRLTAAVRQAKPGATQLLGQALTRLKLRTQLGSQTLDLPTWAHPSRLAGTGTPQAGDTVAGRVWLQAQLIGPA